jgi:hypothetical protein
VGVCSNQLNDMVMRRKALQYLDFFLLFVAKLTSHYHSLVSKSPALNRHLVNVACGALA